MLSGITKKEPSQNADQRPRSLVAAVVWRLRVAVFNLELSTNIREVKQSAEKAPTRAFSLLKPTSAFTVKYLRDYT